MAKKELEELVDNEIEDNDDGGDVKKKKKEKKRKSKEEKLRDRRIVFWVLLIITLISLITYLMAVWQGRSVNLFKGGDKNIHEGVEYESVKPMDGNEDKKSGWNWGVEYKL